MGKSVLYKSALFYLIVASIIVLAIAAPLYLLILSGACLVCIAIIKRPVLALGFYIMMVPFANIGLFNRVPGLRSLGVPASFIIFIAGCFFAARLKFSLSQKEFVYIIFFLAVILIDSLRAVPYVMDILLDESYNSVSWIEYIRIDIIKPVAYFLPLLLVAAYVQNMEDIDLLAGAMVLSLTGLSIALILVYIFVVPDRMDFEVVRNTFSQIFYEHGNGIVNHYIIGFPVLISYYMKKKNLFAAGSVFLSVIGVGILYSRTAYVIVILSVFAFLILSGYKKVLPVFIVLVIVAVIVSPSTIKGRMLSGLSDNSEYAMDTGQDISAGRISNIWMPTIRELAENPLVLTFGGGKYYFLKTEAQHDALARVGLFIDHPHNCYLDAVVKTGLTGLVFLMIFFIRLLLNFFKRRRTILDPYHGWLMSAVIIGILAYLIRGITDSTLFPEVNNLFLWIVIGLGIAIVRIEGKHKNGGCVSESIRCSKVVFNRSCLKKERRFLW